MRIPLKCKPQLLREARRTADIYIISDVLRAVQLELVSDASQMHVQMLSKFT